MPVKTIPKSKEYTCDACEETITVEARDRYDHEAVPDGWAYVNTYCNQLDVAGDHYKRTGLDTVYLCPKHAAQVLILIDKLKGEKIDKPT